MRALYLRGAMRMARRAALWVATPFLFVLVVVLLLLGGGGQEQAKKDAEAALPAADPGLPLSGGPGSAGLRPGVIPNGWQPLVEAAGRQCPEITAPIIGAQIEQESSWVNGQTSATVAGMHRGGAMGLAQFMPATWAEYGAGGNPMIPADAIAAQGRYDCALAAEMKALVAAGKAKGDLVTLTLAAYNAGPNRVSEYGGVPPFLETQNYVKDIPKRAAEKYATAEPIGGAATTAGDFGTRVVAAAQQWSGLPYSWGGGTLTGPGEGSGRGAGVVGFDCSGLVRAAVYLASGKALELPRTADQQARTGTPVALDQLRPGDAVAFSSNGGASFHHIGIYVGNGQIINAPETGDVVRVIPISNWINRGQYTVARRYR